MTLAEKIKQIREQKKMTQKEVASLMGISQQAYYQYESGTREPKKETIYRIADALGVSVSALSADDDLLSRITQKATSKRFEFQLSKMEGYLGQLNEEGRNIALERVRELAEIPRYQDADGRRAAQEQNQTAIESMQGVETPTEIQKLIQEFSRRGELPEGYTGIETTQTPTESPQNAAGDVSEDTAPKED